MRDKIISNVRLQSAAGWYVGTVSFSEDNAEPYERDSMYYPSEESLQRDEPRSISLKEAVDKARVRKWTTINIS